ncbi:phage portal protein [Merdimmobilis hominis]|uniref:phage portal protein n=1 Tax=Merdimmobilis hominis TaxID=2897707 RepID=UPI0008F9332C|nr:phage portal protein [Merdimmobilis hominis]
MTLETIAESLPAMATFGDDLYRSDTVRQAVRAIAEECGKITLKSVIEQENPHKITVVKDDITQLFSCRPNPYQSTADFFEQVVYQWLVRDNAFIYRKYETRRSRSGLISVHKAFYPLNPTRVEFQMDGRGGLYLKLGFLAGESFTLPYSSFIHLRREYGPNPLLGGDAFGQVDTREGLKTAQTLDRAQQLIPKALEAGLSMNGVFVARNVAEADKLKKERDRFEKSLESSASGIAAIDLAGEFIPITKNAKVIDKEVLEYLENKLIKGLGVSPAILSGDFTETQSSAFYQKCIETFIVKFEQAMTGVCYTPRERAQGRKVKIYDRQIQHMSLETRLKIAEIYMPTGYIGEDEARELIGMEPRGVQGGVQSLNYVERQVATQYQMRRAGQGKAPDEPLTPKKEEE